MFEESSATVQLKKALEEYEKYLKKLKKSNPNKPSEYEQYTAPLVGAIGNSMLDIKNSINIQTVIMTIGFVGLGIIITIS